MHMAPYTEGLGSTTEARQAAGDRPSRILAPWFARTELSASNRPASSDLKLERRTGRPLKEIQEVGPPILDSTPKGPKYLTIGYLGFLYQES